MIRRLALLVVLMLLAMVSGVAMLRRFMWTAADEAELAQEERWFREYAAGDVAWNETGEVVA